MNSQCRKRAHRWDNGPKPGSRCTRPDCLKWFEGKPTFERKTPPAAAPAPAATPAATPAVSPAPEAQPTDLRRATNEALRARWGLGVTPAAAPAVPTTTTAEPAKAIAKPSSDWDLGEILKDELPDLLVEGEKKLIDLAGRVPNPPDDEWQKRLKKCTDRILSAMDLNVEISPWWMLLACLLFIFLSMWSGAEKKAPAPTAGKKPTASPAPVQPPADGSTTADGTDLTPDSLRSPLSSPLTPPLSLVHDAGNATNAPT